LGFLLVAILVLAVAPFRVEVLQAQLQEDQYSLELQGFAWDHTTLSALIVRPGNISGWNNDFLNASLRAIGQWNEAIGEFAANYSDYAYLASVQMMPTVSDHLIEGYDIYINWTDMPLRGSADEVGLAKISALQSRTIVNCTVTLAVQTEHQAPLNVVDMQNIALHELGHVLGVGHSNYTDDLMYPLYTLRGNPEMVSTLNAYGVATLFAWLVNPGGFIPVDAWLTQTSVTLPSEVSYSYLPVSPQNAAPQSLATNPIVEQLVLIATLLLHPEFLVLIAVILGVAVVLGLILRQRRPVARAAP
jgi:hypothetical protein